MKKKKKIICLLLVIVLTLVSGCSAKDELVFQPDGSGVLKETVKQRLEENEQISDYQDLYDGFTVTEVVEDDTRYLSGTKELPFSEIQAAYTEGTSHFDKDFFSMDIGTQTNCSGLDDYTMSATFPYPVIKTNGKLSADKKTVTWTKRNFLIDSTAVAVFSGSCDYKITLSGTDAAGYCANPGKLKLNYQIAPVNITLDGTKTSESALSSLADGFYHIQITTIDRLSYNERIVVDTQKPVVSGVKNKKTYKKKVTFKISDKTSGIQTVTLNGKPVGKKKTIKKNGKYTLTATDQAGNRTVIKFTIKK